MFNPQMPYRSLGQCGTKVSQFSLGGWTTFGGTVKDMALIKKIHKIAYEAGINFFDNADIYAKGESETVVGEVLKDYPRHELVISSKVFWPMSEDINDKGLSRKHIFESVNKSLKRMQTDYFDIYFCHRPDPETPMEETVRAMDDLVRQGKVLYWGTSEWSSEELKQAHAISKEGGFYRPQVEQPQYSLIARERFEKDIQPAVQKLGMGIVSWSPLASGMLTGKYDNGIKGGRLSQIDWLQEMIYTDENVRRVKELKGIAEELRCSRTQLALAWTAAQPAISSVILGATSAEQLQENLGALKVQISTETDKKIKAIFKY